MIGVPFSRSCGERRDARNFDSMIQDNLHMRWRFCGRTTPAGWSCTTTSIGYRRPISNFADGDGCSFSSRPSFLVFFFSFLLCYWSAQRWRTTWLPLPSPAPPTTILAIFTI
ncbi:hypothetical protein M433DRAFT_391735 [Acidomyces richmondensis BFW]|nr:hypothetical protein M433DRAFT_391735 [Acidomyces richmondensis BFW]